MGEIAFADYAGLHIDTNEYRRTDGGGDFRVEYQNTRCTIDIKTANKKPYALMVKEGTDSADYYIQGHLDNLTVRFYGMTTVEKVRSRELKDTPPKYDHRNYQVPIEELNPVPDPESLTPVG